MRSAEIYARPQGLARQRRISAAGCSSGGDEKDALVPEGPPRKRGGHVLPTPHAPTSAGWTSSGWG